MPCLEDQPNALGQPLVRREMNCDEVARRGEMWRCHPVDVAIAGSNARGVEAIAIGLTGNFVGIDEDLQIRAADLHLTTFDCEKEMPDACTTGVGDDEAAVSEPSRHLFRRPLFRL